MSKKLGRNTPCPCGAMKPNGEPQKYKNCCELKQYEAIKKLKEEMKEHLPEPFERGGFITGRPFISVLAQNQRFRAVKNIVYKRPATETFHEFILRELAATISNEWIDAELKKDEPHILANWFKETQDKIGKDIEKKNDKVSSVELTGNMRTLLAIAYDLYSVHHCSEKIKPKLINRLKNKTEFHGAKFELAVAGIACRAGFEIEWYPDDGKKKGEFWGVHKVTKEKAVFEAKSHARDGILGKEGEFVSEHTRTKIIDHVRKALLQTVDEDLPVVIFDDLNLPLTKNSKSEEKKWFKEVESDLEKYGFLSSDEYKKCAVLIITNFAWHFHDKIPENENELVTHFHVNSKYSLRADTVLNYLDTASKQYGHVPALLYEFDED